MDAFPYAAVVTYMCEPGHVLAGTASIFCTTVDGEHGAWSGPPPHCGGTASWSYRMAWVGKDLKDHLVPTPLL